MAEKRQPWGKWYWGDWRKDARLRRCCYGSRGLWADMLSLMGGECDEFGFLMMEGQALGPADLVGLLGGALREVSKLLAELGDKRVYSRTGDADLEPDLRALIPAAIPHGVIFSRRMLRDKAKAEKDRENGKGGGNPRLNPKSENEDDWVNHPDKAQKPEARDQNPKSSLRSDTPAAFEKSADGPSPRSKPKKTAPKIDFPPWWPHEKYEAFAEMRRSVRAKLTPDAIYLHIKKLTEWRDQGHDVIAILDQSIMNSYKGLFPVKQDSGGRNGGHQKSSIEPFGAGLSRSIQEGDSESGLFDRSDEIIDITPTGDTQGNRPKAA